MKMIIGLTFPGELKDESIICNLCKNFDIKVNIFEASFSMYSGWAILGIEGEEEELKKSFDFLRTKNINIEKIETK
jgi:ABC-type methionine transport system ATPase subunit